MRKLIKILFLTSVLICLFGCNNDTNSNKKPSLNEEAVEDMNNLDTNDDNIIKIAFIGDSVTSGYLTANPITDAYPGQLQKMLGDGYEIMNFGYGGACAISDKDENNVYSKKEKYYKNTEMYKLSMEYDADIVVIMLGGNDRPTIYPDSKVLNTDGVESYKYWMSDLAKDYEEKGAIVYIASSNYAPVDKVAAQEYKDGILYDIQKEFAEENNYKFIDTWSYTREYFSDPIYFQSDKLHPNYDGQKKIAEAFKLRNDEEGIFNIK